jgi:HlyD family secretion protein
MRAEVEGLIETIHVEEGDWVKKGDLIAHLAERDCRAELKKIAAEIDEKQARLKLLKAGTRAEELELARITLKKTQERLKYAKEKYQLYQILFDQKLASLKELNETKEALAVRQKEQEEAQGTLTLLLAGKRPEEIEALEAENAALRTLLGQCKAAMFESMAANARGIQTDWSNIIAAIDAARKP